VSSRRRLGIVALRMMLLAALLLELAATHLPTPSGVGEESAEDVRGAWSALGTIGRAAASFVPDVVGALVRPIADDKTVHVLLFLPLGLLWALERRLVGKLDARTAAILVLSLAVYAAVGESSQALVGRIAEVGDWVANCVGAALGVGVGYLLTRSWRARSESLPSTPGSPHLPTRVR